MMSPLRIIAVSPSMLISAAPSEFGSKAPGAVSSIADRHVARTRRLLLPQASMQRISPSHSRSKRSFIVRIVLMSCFLTEGFKSEHCSVMTTLAIPGGLRDADHFFRDRREDSYPLLWSVRDYRHNTWQITSRAAPVAP